MASGNKNRKRVLVLTERFWPEPNFITADVAERLGRSADVTVVAPHPSYPQGRFYSGTRWWRPVRTVERGVTVWRVPFIPSQSLSLGRRASSYLSFAVVAAITAPLVCPSPDVVWVYHGPFTTGLASLGYRLRRRFRLVITAADLWPESLTASGVARPGLMMRALRGYSRWINSFADHIVCSTEGIARRYGADGVPGERLTVVPVWIPGVERMVAAPADEDDTRCDVVYAGNLGPAQQLETLIRAAAILERTSPGVCVHLYGSGSAEGELKRLASELGVRNVHFHGRVDPAEAFARSAAAAVQVVSLRRSPEFEATVPSKLSLCLAAAAPFVYGLQGDAAEIARRSGGGFSFDPGDPVSLAAAIESAAAMSAEERVAVRTRLRRYYEEQFSPRTLLERYATLLLES